MANGMELWLLGAGVIAVLAFLLVRAHKLRQLQQLGLTLSRSLDLSSYRSARTALERELSRARRGEQPLSVVVIQSDRADDDAGPSGLLEYLHCARVLPTMLRDIDIVTYDSANHRLVVVLPETGKAPAHQAALRLTTKLAESAASRLTMGVASFPEDGLLVHDLVEAATREALPEYAKSFRVV